MKKLFFVTCATFFANVFAQGELVLHVHIPRLSIIAGLKVPGLKHLKTNKYYENPSFQEAYELQQELLKKGPGQAQLLLGETRKDSRKDIPDIFWYKILYDNQHVKLVIESLRQAPLHNSQSKKFNQSLYSLLSHFHTPNNWVLLKAAELGEADIVTQHLLAGADVHFQDNSSLYVACRYGHYEVAEKLIAFGAHIQKDHLNHLETAASYGQASITSLLLAHGADVHYQQDSALYTAASKGYLDIVKILLQAGADKEKGLQGAQLGLNNAKQQKDKKIFINIATSIRNVSQPCNSNLLSQK